VNDRAEAGGRGVIGRVAYRLVLEALPDSVPPAVRLRRLLKALGRDRYYGFRCLSVMELKPGNPARSRPNDPKGVRHDAR
jgi:hypothetical protein